MRGWIPPNLSAFILWNLSYSSATSEVSSWRVCSYKKRPSGNLVLFTLGCISYCTCLWKCLCVCVEGAFCFQALWLIWIISAFSPWTPGEVAAVGHSGTGALQEPHSQLYTGLHCGRGGLRHYKSVSLMKYFEFLYFNSAAGPLSVRLVFLLVS